MAEHEGQRESAAESLVDKITEKISGHDSSSSSDSDNEKFDAVKSKIFRLFGREKPVHKVLGGGKRKQTLTFSLSFIYFMEHIIKNTCVFNSLIQSLNIAAFFSRNWH
jgi:hypothetical protein